MPVTCLYVMRCFAPPWTLISVSSTVTPDVGFRCGRRQWRRWRRRRPPRDEAGPGLLPFARTVASGQGDGWPAPRAAKGTRPRIQPPLPAPPEGASRSDGRVLVPPGRQSPVLEAGFYLGIGVPWRWRWRRRRQAGRPQRPQGVSSVPAAAAARLVRVLGSTSVVVVVEQPGRRRRRWRWRP